MANDFHFTTLPKLDKRVFRLGIAGNYGIEPADVLFAGERGVNYWVWGSRFAKVTVPLRELLRQDREKHVVTVLGMGLWAGQVRKGVEKALRELATDYIDVFKLAWLGRSSRLSPRIVQTLLQLKREGKVRALGASIHDRQRAAELARDSELDLFMVRYNAKHPGAEQDLFPALPQRNPAVVAYTATSWRQLLRPIAGIEMRPWPGEGELPPLTAAHCYRFCLSSPHVHVVLSGPRNREELQQNLEALDDGALEAEELEWIRTYGREVKKRKRLDYV
jgi:aryl-alcohol dehydrogenase-like predicted oxidoreductase